VANGVDVFKALQMACINPVSHYKLPIGQLNIGDSADFVMVQDLQNFKVLTTYIDGQIVAQNGVSLLVNSTALPINNFKTTSKKVEEFKFSVEKNQSLKVIECIDGQLITNQIIYKIPEDKSNFESDIAKDILKIAVVNRYNHSKVAIAFIKNFGLTTGAIASSVAHDSHNIVAVGTSDKSLCQAINMVIEAQGGISAVADGTTNILKLPIAGLMATGDGYEVASQYTAIDLFSKQVLGSSLNSPFMSLSFMALLVIPQLKLSDLGLFCGKTFALTSHFE
jgi:adenine deaminase